jgi:sulfite reductase (NADPH) flavoprotein alpha-component
MNELPRLIPDDAPFSPAQRAWLNGFLAGLFGPAQTPASEKAEDFPWHDPVLDMDERMALAEGRPLPRRLMAAMAQLDCGQCGYLCRTYAEAIAEGRESATSLCVPGGKPTQRALKQILAATPAAAPVADPPKAPAAAPAPKVRVVSAARLSGEGSAKDVRHIVIDLAGSGLEYEPGDSISIGVRHDPALVEATLAALHATGDEDFGGMTLREALASRLDIARPLDRTADLLAMCATDPSEAAALRALADGDDGAEPADADLLDLLHAFPSARPPLRDLARSLPTLKPRVYSIASSPRATPAQVHLCVDVVRAERRGRVRHGVGSSFLRRIAEDQGEVTASIVTSHFRLPAEPDRPIIIVGPGTGIAPFRAFLQHRAATGASMRPATSCSATSCTPGAPTARSRASPPPSPATSATRSMCNTACWRTPRKFGAGCRTAPASTSAATPLAWPGMWTRRYGAWHGNAETWTIMAPGSGWLRWPGRGVISGMFIEQKEVFVLKKSNSQPPRLTGV